MNARNLMLNVVIFEFTFIKATLFVTNVDKMNEFKKIEGQAWSAWKKFIEENKLSDDAPDGQTHKKDTSKETASCMKLPRSDMALFGLCPKTELFELVVCNFCGSKFKLAAFADHIRTRHSDINDTSPKIKKKTSPSPKTSDTKLKVDNNVQKKGKNKKTKDKLIKPKEKVDSPAKIPINFDVKVGLVDIVNSKPQILSSEADHSSSVKLKNNSILSDDTLKEESKSSSSTLKPEPIDNKACNGSDDTSTSKTQVPIEENTTTQEAEKVNLQLVVQLIPISTNDASSEPPPPPAQEIKGDSECQEKNTRVESTISTDQQFNILDKDNSGVNQVMLNPTSEVNSATTPVLLNSSSKINSKSSPVLTSSSSKTSSMLLNSSLQFASKSSPVLFNSLQNNSKQSTMLINSSTEPISPASTVPLNSTSQRSPSELTNSAKGKSLEVTLSEKSKEMEASREIPVHNEVSSSSTVEIEKLPVSSNAGKTVKSHILVNHKLNKTDVIKLEQEHLKRLARIRPRLSLPVSIKNPSLTNSILSQLQNKVMQSKFSMPIDATSNDGIQDVIKENFVQKRRKNARPNRCFKENSRGQQNTIKKEGDTESPETKTEEKKVEGVTMFYPGCRRSGGLLTSNHNLPRVKRSLSKKNTASSVRKEDTNSSINQSNISNLSERNEIINIVVNNISNKNDNNVKKIQLEIDSNMKRPLKLQSKQKGLQKSKNSRKINSQQHKIINNQIASKNKTSICKRLNDNINGAVPAKVKRQEGLMNIVGSILTKNEHKLPKMNIEVQSNMFEKKVLSSSQHVTATIDLTNEDDSVPSGVEVISGNILRTSSFVQIGTPRMHYFTSSGPLPVPASLTSIQQQFQLKNLRVHLQDALNPQVNMVPDGNMFIIKKSKTNSTHFNGIEEK